jgi:hypothetical protein
MHKWNENSDPVAQPIGTVAIVEHLGLLCVGLKGDDGTWRDGRGRILTVGKIVEVISSEDVNKKGARVSTGMNLLPGGAAQ